ncbi:MAG: SUMF1/EgtB/PvdO family nonheme iron enzyme [Ardenticatenales bacterium]
MPVHSARSPIDLIGPPTVRQALAAVRHLESKARRQPNPLLGLLIVDVRLREMGVTASDENRQWALAGALVDLVTERLAALRREENRPGARFHAAGATPARELARLADDFRAGDHVRECWSAIHSRFISTASPPMDEVARVAGVGRVTLARRLNQGLALLSNDLRRRELELARHDTLPYSPRPAQRVRVHPHGGADLTQPPSHVARRVLESVQAERHPGIDLSAADALALVSQPPADLEAYRVARIAAWSQLRHALDQRFVRLFLVVDAGEEEPAGRWQTGGQHDDLAAALDAAGSPVVALLGAPGSGKSSLLGRFELDEAVAALHGETDAVTFFVPLGQYRPVDDRALNAPGLWLEERWKERNPDLPELADFRAQGRLTLLLDGLNEMPHHDGAEYHARVAAWRRYLVDELAPVAGNRAVVTCRSLDYSAPLSSAELRVPQVQVEPLSDDQVRTFLFAHRPALADRLWAALAGTAQLAVLRVPYALKLLVDQAGPTGDAPGGVAALFTGMVRQALRREIERDHPAFRPSELVDQRDVRQVTQWRWRTPYELPERGRLIPGLADLAWGMQALGIGGAGAQVRVDRSDALALAAAPPSGGLIRAGLALAVLDEEVASDEVSFRHQLLQEYFAARRLAASPESERVRQAWRAEDMTPPLADMTATLPAGEPLPPLPATGWEETTALAAEMAADATAFVERIADTNLALAGECAARPGVAERMDDAAMAELRRRLVERSRDPAADVRARIAAARALGTLGDPRWPRRAGPDGDYLDPPLVEIAGGRYPIGRTEPFEALGRKWWPRYTPHDVQLAGFALGQFPVTNAEWACFMAAGGYDDERWWDTPAAAAWRSGVGTMVGIHASIVEWVQRYRANPDLLEATRREGGFSDEVYERWRRRLAMTQAELERHMAEIYPSRRETAPRQWNNRRFNHPAQPVVAVTWYEARAYCAWLAAQTGRPFRLPTDAELEAAGRGPDGRDYPWGGPFDALRLNCVFSHIMATTPVGVYPDGDSRDGITDLAGNVETWTSTLVGDGDDTPPNGAREWRPALEAADDPPTARRIVRGGSWSDNHSRVHPCYAVGFGADFCPETVGVRVACSVDGGAIQQR